MDDDDDDDDDDNDDDDDDGKDDDDIAVSYLYPVLSIQRKIKRKSKDHSRPMEDPLKMIFR